MPAVPGAPARAVSSCPSTGATVFSLIELPQVNDLEPVRLLRGVFLQQSVNKPSRSDPPGWIALPRCRAPGDFVGAGARHIAAEGLGNLQVSSLRGVWRRLTGPDSTEVVPEPECRGQMLTRFAGTRKAIPLAPGDVPAEAASLGVIRMALPSGELRCPG
ncbi:hypothetical protein Slala03_71580 [Streptomyces lavendulae subsp. lavendulae]|nr:hypothetical protein Slala03_71580 [Streptomyces lavendulae subsp. lavendulae]